MKDRLTYNNEMHKTGRLFTWISLAAFMLVPIIFCLVTGAKPQWSALGKSFMFILGYWAIGLVEAVSYAPLLGSGGQYQTFITGNIANLKLPCAINTQTILKTKQGSEEEEVITTISVAVSTIVTMLIILIGLIPLSIFSTKIVTILAPVSPYVIPAIFGGLGVALLSRYLKLTIIPFIVCLAITITTFALNIDIGQSTMIPIGMAVSIAAAFIIYKKEKK
ncbi:MAG: hypothetical protein QM214_00155 [Bacillota bacterium]|jgi:hypothetical protein|nr:hypothetical protein [Bacillota bacterium]HHU43734.1 hypothetical protein [Clostridiales bacterium]